MAAAIGLKVEWRAEPLRHLDLLATFARASLGSNRTSFGSSKPLQRTRSRTPSWTLRSKNKSAWRTNHRCRESRAPHADRPAGRGQVEREALLDLVQQVERVSPLAVELVDKGDDRHVAQAADLEELAGPLLDAA